MNFKQIKKNKFNISIYISENGEEKKAVLSAMISRSFDLSACIEKIEQNENKVINFLDKNLFQYNHASIADLGNITIFIANIGWITSLFLKDTPLFNGQETSTRVLTGSKEMCNDSNADYVHEHHLFWWNIFNELQGSRVNLSQAYKFDDIRWSLPGTYRSSIVMNLSVRVFARQIQMLSYIPECKELSDELKIAFEAATPIFYKTLMNKERLPHKRWLTIPVLEIDKVCDIQITPPKDLKEKFQQYFFSPRKHEKVMLDDTLSFLGMFNIKIQTSIIIARDFARHRTWHPFTWKLLTKNNQPFLDPKINIPGFIEDKINNKFNNIKTKELNIFELYQYPVGTMVELEASTTLNFLIYALELRAFASGADESYSCIAKNGINIIKEILINNNIDLNHFLLV